jgi:hypothetical protein
LTYDDEPPITAEQAQQIRALLREAGASEASLLKELDAPSIEGINSIAFKRALSILELWRLQKKGEWPTLHSRNST